MEKNGKVFTTKNAGRTWISQSESDAQLKGLGEFRYKAETNTLSITFTNKTKYSTNYGASWKKYSHQPKNSVETLSEDLYIQVYPTVYHADYIAGDPVPTIPKIVFEKKAPQGAFGTEVKFNQIPNSDTMSLRTMRMFDQNLGYMLIADTKFNMQVYKTENAWVSFDKIATIPQASTYSMTVFSRDTLFFNSGMDFFYSFDGGIQWGKTTFEFLNTGLKILPSELVFLKNGGFIIPNSNGFYVGGELKGTNLNDPLGVNKDLFSQKEVEDLFYPNPSSGELFFTSDVHLEKIVIYNAAGYQVLETKYSSKIDVSALSKGVYILKMEKSLICLLKILTKI